MGWLLLLFIVVPMAELALLIQIGRWVGLLPTLGLIVLTGAVGAALARHQGLEVLSRVRRELDQGRLPASQMVDGVIILVAGAVLMTPGVLTDLFGFFCLVPAGRAWFKKRLRKRFEGAVETGRIRVSVNPGAGGFGRSERPVRDVTPEDPPKVDGL